MIKGSPGLSHKAKALWAKAPRGDRDGGSWLPLRVHMADAAETANLLWHEWLLLGTKKIIAGGTAYAGKSGVDLLRACEIIKVATMGGNKYTFWDDHSLRNS